MYDETEEDETILDPYREQWDWDTDYDDEDDDEENDERWGW